MLPAAGPTPAPAAPPPAGDAGFGYSFSYRNAWKAVAVTLATLLVELALLQLFAVGATTGIYHLAPHLDAGSPRGFRDWLSILQVVSATLTLPGGAAMVLSSWMAARWVRMAEQERVAAAQQEAKRWQEAALAARDEAAEAQADATEARADATEARAEAAAVRASVATIESTLASLQAQAERRRGRRRRLRR